MTEPSTYVATGEGAAVPVWFEDGLKEATPVWFIDMTKEESDWADSLAKNIEDLENKRIIEHIKLEFVLNTPTDRD